MNLHVMAKKIVFFLVRKEIVSQDKSEIYSFGFEILLATILNGILVVIASLALGAFWQSILMLIPFLLIRANAGGFHAKTHAGCILGFISVYLCGIVLAKYLPYELTAPAAFIGILIGAGIILAVGIRPHKNRPVTDQERAYYHIKTIHLTIRLFFAGLLGICLKPEWFIYFTLGMDIAAGSLLTECIRIKCEGRKQHGGY